VLVAVVRRGLAYVLLPLIGCRVVCPQLIGQLRTSNQILTTLYMRQQLLKKHYAMSQYGTPLKPDSFGGTALRQRPI
jgi:hypothetical protein